MDQPLFYLVVLLISIVLIYAAYDKFFLIYKDSYETLKKLEGFECAERLNSSEGVLAFDFERQRVAVVKRKNWRVLDISQIRNAEGQWDNDLTNGVLREKNFRVKLSIADFRQPEIFMAFYEKNDVTICLEMYTQMIERRNSDVLEHRGRAMPKDVVGSAMAVILTAIETETASVLSHFTRDEDGEVSVSGTIFHKGKFCGARENWTIAVAEIGPRNVNAALIAERAIQSFKPHVALFVGIAGGIKDVELADVVAATKIYSYESGKETKSGFLVRPELRLTSHVLEQKARSVRIKGKWVSRLRQKHSKIPSAIMGPIAAGDVLIETSKRVTAQLIKQHYGDAIAAEMEGYGFLSALHLNHSTHGMVIRGISDLLDAKSKTDTMGWQSLASDSAAAFAFELLSELESNIDAA